MNRRSLLISLPIMGATVALPIPMAHSEEPDPTEGLVGFDLAHHYAVKLAEAMAAPEFVGTWAITIKSHAADQDLSFTRDLAHRPATSRVDVHARHLAEAMNEINPGRWRVVFDDGPERLRKGTGNEFIMIVREGEA